MKLFQVASDIGMAEHLYRRADSKIIVSSYMNGGKPSTERLGHLIACMQSTGADVIKLEINVDYITDLAPVFQMLTYCQVFLYSIDVNHMMLCIAFPTLLATFFRKRISLR
jgi:3-dehydroquinate dehydratase/shikimate dehydrogenase